jgi:hypothetical protein
MQTLRSANRYPWHSGARSSRGKPHPESSPFATMRGKRLALTALTTMAVLSFAEVRESYAGPVDTWEAFDAAARPLAEQVSFLAAEITDGDCEPVHALDADLTPVPHATARSARRQSHEKAAVLLRPPCGHSMRSISPPH